jgi:hypothetical protein
MLISPDGHRDGSSPRGGAKKATTSGGFFYCASFYRYELLRLHFIFPNYKPILYWHD